MAFSRKMQVQTLLLLDPISVLTHPPTPAFPQEFLLSLLQICLQTITLIWQSWSIKNTTPVATPKCGSDVEDFGKQNNYLFLKKASCTTVRVKHHENVKQIQQIVWDNLWKTENKKKRERAQRYQTITTDSHLNNSDKHFIGQIMEERRDLMRSYHNWPLI